MRRLLLLLVIWLGAFCFMVSCQKDDEKVAVTGISLNTTSLTMTEGDKSIVAATVTPDNATNKNVSWTSSDENIATVKNGEVTAVKAGSATITVTTEDSNKTASCQVTVKAKVISVEGVTLDKTSLELTEGDKASLTATVTPDNATNKNVSWTSSDENIATVKNGEVTAVKAGSATITVTTEDSNKTASCQVTVKVKEVDMGGNEDVGFEDW